MLRISENNLQLNQTDKLFPFGTNLLALPQSTINTTFRLPPKRSGATSLLKDMKRKAPSPVIYIPFYIMNFTNGILVLCTRK
ncbi:hypothetical protein AEQU2_00280 [Aequorivita lipolytica]|nr:hypothetical protein AEQU2_00280 [Aequorivita lipolytica]